MLTRVVLLLVLLGLVVCNADESGKVGSMEALIEAEVARRLAKLNGAVDRQATTAVNSPPPTETNTSSNVVSGVHDAKVKAESEVSDVVRQRKQAEGDEVIKRAAASKLGELEEVARKKASGLEERRIQDEETAALARKKRQEAEAGAAAAENEKQKVEEQRLVMASAASQLASEVTSEKQKASVEQDEAKKKQELALAADDEAAQKKAESAAAAAAEKKSILEQEAQDKILAAAKLAEVEKTANKKAEADAVLGKKALAEAAADHEAKVKAEDEAEAAAKSKESLSALEGVKKTAVKQLAAAEQLVRDAMTHQPVSSSAGKDDAPFASTQVKHDSPSPPTKQQSDDGDGLSSSVVTESVEHTSRKKRKVTLPPAEEPPVGSSAGTEAQPTSSPAKISEPSESVDSNTDLTKRPAQQETEKMDGDVSAVGKPDVTKEAASIVEDGPTVSVHKGQQADDGTEGGATKPVTKKKKAATVAEDDGTEEGVTKPVTKKKKAATVAEDDGTEEGVTKPVTKKKKAATVAEDDGTEEGVTKPVMKKKKAATVAEDDGTEEGATKPVTKKKKAVTPSPKKKKISTSATFAPQPEEENPMLKSFRNGMFLVVFVAAAFAFKMFVIPLFGISREQVYERLEGKPAVSFVATILFAIGTIMDYIAWGVGLVVGLLSSNKAQSASSTVPLAGVTIGSSSQGITKVAQYSANSTTGAAQPAKPQQLQSAAKPADSDDEVVFTDSDEEGQNRWEVDWDDDTPRGGDGVPGVKSPETRPQTAVKLAAKKSVPVARPSSSTPNRASHGGSGMKLGASRVAPKPAHQSPLQPTSEPSGFDEPWSEDDKDE